MNYNNNYNFVLRNTTDHFYKFSLSEDNSLLLETSSNASTVVNYTIQRDIADYSVDIDQYDKIHILLLTKSGDLFHRIFPSTNSQKKLTEINFASHTVKFLTLKTIKDDIHIFYMLNLNHSDIWSIYHNIWHNNSWRVKKIVDVTAGTLLYPYMIDCTKDNIYLFYSKDSKYSYGIKKFSVDFLTWEDLDENIELTDSHNATFLINDKSVAFICYNTLINRNIYTVIRYRNLNNNYLQWSNPIHLSDPSINALHPSIVVKNNYTFIFWEEGSNIVYRKTDSGLINWTTKIILAAKNSSISSGIYISSHPSDTAFKNTFCPIVQDVPPYPLIKKEKEIQQQFFNKNEKTAVSEAEDIFNMANIISNNDYIKQLQLILLEKDKKLLEVIGLKESLSKEVTLLKVQLAEKESEIVNLQQKLFSTEEEMNAFLQSQNKKIISLNEVINNSQHHSANEAAASLTDKESTIERLNILVNSLYQENNYKDIQIQELEQKLNKGILRRLFG